MDHGSMSLKEKDLRILIFGPLLGFLEYGLVLGGWLGGKVSFWACRKRLKTWVEILSWVKIKVYDGRFDSWAWKV